MKTIEYRKKLAIREEKENYSDHRDINFIGSYHPNKEKWEKKGFFNLYHGIKETEKNTIESLVKIAEDNQAIYEFLQNAIDANSSNFMVFYDNDYFAVINNGEKFSEDGIESILNIAQSTKSEDEKKIGKFGVGFKLIHRLVGKGSGIEEIIDEYKGPILFSWDKYYIKNLLNNDLTDIDSHWLFKIIYTNFPCGVEETIRGKKYEEIKPFKKNEINEMCSFLKKQIIDLSILEEGSIFFLKLGEKKTEMLQKEQIELQNGISSSLNILKALREDKQGIDEVNLNDIKIKKDNFEIITNGKYVFLYPNLNNAIEYYNKDTSKKISFFKFFPMGDQLNNLNFLIHHSDYIVKTDRRKLQEVGDNKKIFEDIWSDISDKLNKYKEKDIKKFTEIVASFYLSDLEKANGNDFIVQNFTKYILAYIKEYIPFIKIGEDEVKELQTTSDKSKIIIVDSYLDNIPLKHHNHFYFSPKLYKEIVREAKNKIDIKRWNIVDVFLNDDIEKWIFKLNDKDFNRFLKELSEHKKSSMAIVNKFKSKYDSSQIDKILKIFETIKDENLKFAIIEINGKYDISTKVANIYIKNQHLKDFLIDTYELEEMSFYLIPDKFEKQILAITKQNPDDKNIIKELLDNNQHKELIGFIDTKELKEYFLDSLKRIDFDTSLKYHSDSFELKVLDMMIEYSDNFEEFKNKIYIDKQLTQNLSKSPFITFKYGTKVINPNSWDNYEKDKNISEFIENLDLKYKNIFNIEEESKDIVYETIKKEIKSNYRLNNKINTKNRLKFIIFYSLEKEANFISEFEGINIYNKDTNKNISFEILYKILSKDINIKNDKQLEIFNIKDFFPENLNKDYYISDNRFAINIEKLPSELEVKYIDTFDKIGLTISDEIVKIRKSLLENKELNSDDLISLTQEKKKNTIQFLAEKNFEFKFDTVDYHNLEKLFKSMDKNIKEKLQYYPCLKNLSTIHILNEPSSSKYYIDKTHLNSKNIIFKERLKRGIEDKKVIFIDILNFDTISSRWLLLEENENEKKEVALDETKKERDDIRAERIKTSDYNERTAQIGREGELLVKEILINKFGADRVIDNNENGESKEIDFEILDETLTKVIHKIEVKATVKKADDLNKDVAFYMSNNQYKKAQKYGKDTHLIFVTGVEYDNPEFLYMNFDNSWLNS